MKQINLPAFIVAVLILQGAWVNNLQAATITVTNSNDLLVDGDGCSLREAIINANENAQTYGDCVAGDDGADDIVFATSTNGSAITLTLDGDDNDSYSGDFDITDELTITGNGQDITIIQGGTDITNGIDRVFEVRDANANFTDLTIQYGRDVSYGAGINNQTDTFNDPNIVFLTTVTRCTIRDNTAHDGNKYRDGGGIWNDVDNMDIIDSIISGNEARYGAGIWNNEGVLTITNSTVSDNTASSYGGGIYNYDYAAYLILTDSTISDNTATYGAGIYQEYDTTTATITNSTISGNVASVNGGGIYNYDGTMDITNSTISGNTAENGGGIYINGNSGGITNLVHTTVTDNTATGTEELPGLGAGIFNGRDIADFGILNLQDSIIAEQASGPNCSGVRLDLIVSLDNNLDDDGSCNLVEANDLSNNANVNLGVLTLNAPGNTSTHALQAGSDAIDAGNCGAGTIIDDQRGISRPQGSACDIGAYELVEDVNEAPLCDGIPATIYVDDNNRVVGGPLNGRLHRKYLWGTNQDDVIVGSDKRDVIYGFRGDDLICGKGGNDTLRGHQGNDSLFGEEGKDWLIGGRGNDFCDGGAKRDTARSCETKVNIR